MWIVSVLMYLGNQVTQQLQYQFQKMISQSSQKIPKLSRLSHLTSSTSKRKQTSQLNQQIKQNQLQWMFNRRKQKLEKTSTQNLHMFIRIQSQKSGISVGGGAGSAGGVGGVGSAGMRRKMTKGRGSVSGALTSRLRIVPNTFRESREIDEEFRRRDQEIKNVLSCLGNNEKEGQKDGKILKNGKNVGRSGKCKLL